jgi:pteridine reductase
MTHPIHRAAPLAGRKALVTGAGVRVGRAIALACAQAGADVAVHYRSSKKEAEKTAAAIKALGRKAPLVQGDQAAEGGPEKIVEDAAALLGGLDLLVLSAAAFEKVPAKELDRARFEAMLASNLTGPFLVARAAHEHLLASGRSRKGRAAIVTILDLCGTSQVWPGYAHYTAAKAGLAALTRMLAVEWAPEIRVNGVAPGYVMHRKNSPPEENARLIKRIPLAREGKADDVAQAVVYLASAPFVSGQILAVDGGRSVSP